MATFHPANKCIYCGATDVRLSDEHIVPYSFNGTLILPKASCASCADTTKKLEQIVGRAMYGSLRIKRGFKTRRMKERPTILPVTFTGEDGVQTTKQVPVDVYPTAYVAIELPSPGIFTGAPLSEMNPEMKLHVKADTEELKRAIESIRGLETGFPLVAAWGALCRMLAKIAHSYLFAILRESGYVSLLPDLILGRSKYLSHYVGGSTEGDCEHEGATDLSIRMISEGDNTYLVVCIELLGRGRLPLYQAVAGRVLNPETVLSASVAARESM